MEVGQEAIDEAEAIARGDEEAGLAVEGPEPSSLTSRRALQKPERGRADGDDLPAPAFTSFKASAVSAETAPCSACMR